MVRRLLICVAAGIIIGLGSVWYMASRNTPERAADRFTSYLAEGEVDKAYRQLSASLASGREQYWRTYLAQFTDETHQPELEKHDKITDSFNTFSDAADPRRLTYKMHSKDKAYRLAILLIKEGKTWKVGELQGSEIK